MACKLLAARSSRVWRSRMSVPRTPRGTRSAAAAASGPGGVVQQMSVNELAEVLSVPELAQELQLVDVREQGEWETARLPHFKLMPLSEAGSWSTNIEAHLDPETPTAVLCHHGVRSMQMCQFLVRNGFQDVKNITGGIDAYSLVDPSIPWY